jgi:hypothetical protein
MSDRIVRIGGAAGAWGDSPMGIGQLLTSDVQYLMMDYLAEVTMSLLARARMKAPDAGYPPDFVAYLKPHLAELSRRRVKVVSNAGGVNPHGCKRALEAICAEQGLALRIAVVEGDDLIPMLAAIRARGIREAVSGAPLPERLLTANAYLGALPIAAALDAGADIVVTGRCVDSALALGILIHEFGWRSDDYDRMAAGSLVGHILECGPQSTGGLYTDWEAVPDWHNIGYPIAECVEDGSFVLTKPADTGGLVIPATAAEQLLYEIGDPAAYLLPDVTADFSQVRISEEEGASRVRISGVRGRPAPASYKVSATYQDGYRAVAMVAIIGMDAARKAERTAQALVDRARMQFQQRDWADFKSVHTEVLGAEASYAGESRARAVREVVLRLVVDHADVKALDLFARELGSVGISFAQGTAGLIGGRPKVTPIVRLCTFFVPKTLVGPISVQLDNEKSITVDIPPGDDTSTATAGPRSALQPDSSPDVTIDVPLIKVAHARSGDKGNTSNIAIFCRRPEYMAHLRTILTAERIAAHFSALVTGPVQRYEAPGVHAFNFVLDNALGGGGMASPRIDPQGKAYGQRALEMMVAVPVAWGLG